MSETINVNVGLPVAGANTTINVNVQGTGQTAPTGGAGPSLDLPTTATPDTPAAGAVSTDQSTAATAVNWQTNNVDIDKINVDEFKALDGMMQEFMSDGNLSASEWQTYEQTRAFYAQGGQPAPTPTPTGGAPAPAAPTNAWPVGDAPLNNNERSFSSVGDPHETTGDGTKFDNELTGDFVKLKSASGDFELETHQQHDDKGRWKGKTLNKTAAVKSGNDTVVYNGDGPGPHTLTINGKNMPLTVGKTYQLPGGGSVSVSKDGVKILSNKGDEVDIHQRDQYIDITGQLSPQRKDGEVRGSLGNFHNDGNKGEDLMGPDGKLYTNVQDFENAWRPQAGDQLFPATGGPTGGGAPTNNQAAIEAELAQMAAEMSGLTKEMSQLQSELQQQKNSAPKASGVKSPEHKHKPHHHPQQHAHHKPESAVQREEKQLRHMEREMTRLQKEIKQQQKK